MTRKYPYGFLNELLDHGQKLTGLPAAVEEALKQNDHLQDAVQRHLEEMKPVYEGFEKDYLEPWKQMQAQAALLVPPLQQHIEEMTRGWSGTLEAILRGLEEFPDETRHGLLAMAQTGWYLDPQMAGASLRKVKEEMEAMSLEEVNAAFANYFREELTRIEDDLVRNHPGRAALIRSAFSAHRNGRFELSIPVLLAQADGISRELTGCQLYNRELASYAKRTALAALEKAYLAPLSSEIPLWYSEGKRGAGFKDLNRHAVLHGESVDYGTEENGLKAVSLLNYISYVLNLPESDEQTHSARRPHQSCKGI